jgi:hypothetical protein
MGSITQIEQGKTMKNQVGVVSLRSAPRLGASLLLASTVMLAVACSSENNPTAPSATPFASLDVEGTASTSAFPWGESSSTLAAATTMVCHRTGGTNDFVVTTIADSALQSHMDHGDVKFSPISLARATFSSSGNAANARLAFDGNPITFWNSGGFPVQYVEIDFGSPQSFSKITALVGQTPSGTTNHQVTLDGTPAFSWTGVTSNGDLLTHKFGTAQTAQKVRITTTASPSWVAWSEIQFPSCA